MYPLPALLPSGTCRAVPAEPSLPSRTCRVVSAAYCGRGLFEKVTPRPIEISTPAGWTSFFTR